jgi:hypothetical protein
LHYRLNREYDSHITAMVKADPAGA